MKHTQERSRRARARASRRSRASRLVVGGALATAIAVTGVVTATPATAGSGGRYTFLDANGAYWGVNFAGATAAELAFVADTDGNGMQELGGYNNGRFTVRSDDGAYWGVSIPGAGRAEIPLAIDTDGDHKQELALYNNGRFTVRAADGSLWGIDFAGAGNLDLPVAADTDGDGRQEFGVYRAGRFTFRRDDNSYWGVDFTGAGANDLPLVIDTDADHKQELAVYNNGRFTIRNDAGGYWGLNFTGAGIGDYPLAVDTNHDGRQELAVYNHVATQVYARQILANPAIGTSYSATVRQDLQAAAVGAVGTGGTSMMSSAIAEVIVTAAHGHSLTINALQSGGGGHMDGSQHYSGDAVDFGLLDGAPFRTWTSPWFSVVESFLPILPNGSNVGQGQCPGAHPTRSGVTYLRTDPCTHLHVDVPSSSPR